jgi:transposase
MTDLTSTVSRFIGCDVGKKTIVVYDSRDGQTRSIPNRPDALSAFAGELDDACFVVCEATGGYEAILLDACSKARIPAHRGDARKIKAFIRSFGILGKTDIIDARWLARYGQDRHAELTRWLPRGECRLQMQALVMTRRDLVAQRLAWNNRLESPTAGAAKPYIQKVSQCLSEQIKTIDGAIAALVNDSKNLKRAIQVLRTIGGVGPKVATALIALMPELGSTSRQRAASLAGLAPHPKQSGSNDAQRHVKGGRPEIKRVLFMAALVAARHDQTAKAFYKRLIQNGKKPLVALTALMRKIITIANAKLRDEIKLNVS